MRGLAAVAVLAAALVFPAVALAYTAQGQLMMGRWAGADRCAAAAQKASPDFTPEGNAKRNAILQQCLAGAGLPPRGDAEQPKP